MGASVTTFRPVIFLTWPNGLVTSGGAQRRPGIVPAYKLRPAGDHDLELAYRHAVPCIQNLPLDAHAVDKRAVGTVVVFHRQDTQVVGEGAMVTADTWVFQNNSAALTSADQRASLSQRKGTWRHSGT
ncbi:hypothetical protein D3C71_1777250 [compost metagenome]